MYIVTTAQMQAAERVADSSGLSYDQMMENAGQAIARAIEEQYEITGESVIVLVGPGNNGGDGLVIARQLRRAGAMVTVYVWKRGNLDNDKNWQRLNDTDVTRIFADDEDSDIQLTHLLGKCTIIVDALLGTGASRPIGGTLAELLDRVKTAVLRRRILGERNLVAPNQPDFDHEIGPVIVAVDLPSGLNSDTGIADPHTLTADLTVTLAAVKRGHILMDGPGLIGHLIVGDIEIAQSHYPAEVTLEMVTATKVARMLPNRPATANKGTFGRAALVAGSISYVGAAGLATQAAIRSGAGWVMLACPQSIHPLLAGQLLDATYLPLPDQQGAIAQEANSVLVDNLERMTAILIGPGLGQADSTVAFVNDFLASLMEHESTPPVVMDADGLNILAQQPEWWTRLPAESILTPHPGEMARLMGSSIKEVQANRLTVATEMAKKWGQIVLLKGAYTIVADPSGLVMVLPFANPALAKAGSGDVLAGTIVSLRAQGVPAFESAVAGAYLHGLAGEIARENIGAMSVTAGDLVGFLPAGIRQFGGT